MSIKRAMNDVNGTLKFITALAIIALIVASILSSMSVNFTLLLNDALALDTDAIIVVVLLCILPFGLPIVIILVYISRLREQLTIQRGLT